MLNWQFYLFSPFRRSAAYIRVGAFDKALSDANSARDLNPRWAKAYYRQGVALHAMALYPNAIAAFASGNQYGCIKDGMWMRPLVREN